MACPNLNWRKKRCEAKSYWGDAVLALIRPTGHAGHVITGGVTLLSLWTTCLHPRHIMALFRCVHNFGARPVVHNDTLTLCL